MTYDIDEGGGAFYGPKIDIKIKDAIGREWQCSTIQFDFNLPERFDMTYIDNNGKKERPFMVHRAIFGSLERFLGVLIEHYSGKFPLWMSSNQVKILCLSDQIVDYCKNIQTQMSQSGLKVQLDASSEKLGYKIRRASEEKVPYMLIVGKRDKENGVVSVRKRGDGDMGQMDIESFIQLVSKDSQIPKVVI
jgi:threonyl-tRNA synthetase